MKYKDYYAILGVDRNASDEEIRKAFRRLARQYHPDISRQDDAEARFKEVNEAYQTLSEPEKREAYDQLGQHRPGEDFHPSQEWDRQYWQSGGVEDFDLADLFEQMGFQTAGRAQKPGGSFSFRGQDYEVAANLSLEEASRGVEVALELVAHEQQADGTVRRVPKTVRIRLPRGVIEGERLRVAGRGGAGIGDGPAGDLYIDIQLKPHRLFRPVGHDLYLEVPITPWEAVLGATMEVPTLDGRLRVTVNPGARAGQKLRLAGQGLPRRKEGAGDLYCVLQLVTPGTITDRERELYQQLAATSTFDPRPHFHGGATHA